MNRLYFGDNLDVLRKFVSDESVDLIYLDPPFNSQAKYNVLFATPEEQRASAQAGAFRDTWSWGDEAEWSYAEAMRLGGPSAKILDALRGALGETDLMAYLAMMTVRLCELRRVLKLTGSLYLHCDPTASHYIKVMMDGIFGHSNFRNEIVWKRTGAHGGAKRWGPVHDTILFYTVSDKYTWNRTFQDYDENYVKEFYKFEDERGFYQLVSLTGAGIRSGDSGKAWRDVDPTATGRHWAVPMRALQGAYPDRDDLASLTTQQKLDLLDQAGRIAWPDRGKVPRQKRYSDENPGVPIQDIVTDIGPLSSHAGERLGYPTQKPVTLLERIVRASSNEGDVVLDPFCGCGTTIAAADALKRQWVGIDVAIHAVMLIEARLLKLPAKPDYAVEGIPKDFASAARLAKNDKYQFQWWANYLFNPHVVREQKKGADRGIDGELFFPNGPGQPWGKVLTSVKGGANLTPAMVREFAQVLTREKADLGLFICLQRPTQAMAREAVSTGYVKTAHGPFPKLQIVAIEDWFEDKGPALPPLKHLPSVAFSAGRRPKKAARPSFFEPEFQFSFVGGKADGVVRTFNPKMVSDVA